MYIRHPFNTNFSEVHNGEFRDLVVDHRPLSRRYLNSIYLTMKSALYEYPRTFMVRFDLRLPQQNFPDSPAIYNTSVISKFFKSLDAKIQHDRKKKKRKVERVHPCRVRYVWAKERAEADTDHYHVAIFLNNDAYSHLGKFNQRGENLRTKIAEAWASALGIDDEPSRGLVHFPRDTPVYYLNRNTDVYFNRMFDGNDDDRPRIFAKAFKRLSYLAKLETKHFGDRTRSFGCSQF